MPGKSHGWRSLVGCGPWGRKELDKTEQLQFHFSLLHIEEGNGNPLQCSCLENPRDRGAWWAAVYGVTQSRTRLKRFSNSSSSSILESINSQLCTISKNKISSHFLHLPPSPPLVGDIQFHVTEIIPLIFLLISNVLLRNSTFNNELHA